MASCRLCRHPRGPHFLRYINLLHFRTLEPLPRALECLPGLITADLRCFCIPGSEASDHGNALSRDCFWLKELRNRYTPSLYHANLSYSSLHLNMVLVWAQEMIHIRETLTVFETKRRSNARNCRMVHSSFSEVAKRTRDILFDYFRSRLCNTHSII